MSRSVHRLFAVAGLSACLTLLPPHSLVGQEEIGEREKVRFYSIDQVELCGTFYPAAKGRKSPCALLIHPPGSGNDHRAWDSLARALQDDGIAVLAFDLRGHGDSTAINETFWGVADNRQLVGGFDTSGPSKTIDVSDYPGAYYPMLVNDIAAARGYLERKNDAGECNVSQLIVVGAGEGAALGAMWLASECFRFRPVGGINPRLESTPAAEDVFCAVWLSPRPFLGKRQVPVLDWLRWAGKDRKVPMGLLYGDGDSKSETFSSRCVAAMKLPEDLREFTAARGVKESMAADMALLDPSLETTKLIRNYIANIRKSKEETTWEPRDFNDQAYYWSWPKSTPMVAKLSGETQLRFLPLLPLGIR